MFRKLVIVILLAIFTSACAAQQATFVSTPPGCKVFVDGREIGVTPCVYDYKLGSNTQHEVTITKDGYDSVDFVVNADETDTEARSRWLVAGAVWSPLWLGTMFTNKLKDTYDFTLRAEPPKMTAAATQASTGKEL